MTVATTALSAQNFWVRSYNTGTSDTARNLQKIFEETVSDLRRSVTWNRIGDAMTALMEAFEECSEPNWDGYGATPILAAAYEEARTFLNALPAQIPVPEIVPEPDGSIGFEWNNGPNRIFVASVNGIGLILYAGILGKCNKTHGTEVFDDFIPANIVESVKRVYS